MPLEPAAVVNIPALYKRNALNLSMFAFVKGARATLHTITVDDALSLFMDSYGLDEDSFNSASARATYYRMAAELKALNQTKKCTTE